MGRSSAVSLAAAVAACGSYQAAKAFVPALTGASTSDAVQVPGLNNIPTVAEYLLSTSNGAAAVQVPGLRGASADAESAPVPRGVLAAGVLSLGAAAVRSSAAKRPATATADQAAPPPPPPPPPPFAPSEQIGVSAPLGFFDPLNFSKVGDEQGFRKLRIAEIKHARVAMMASVGLVVQHYIQFPGFEKVPKGIFAVTSGDALPGVAALFLLSGALDVFLWTDPASKPVDNIGDYGNPFQLGLGKPMGGNEDMKTAQLNNGRAAMIATVGIIVAELVTGKDGMQQFGFE